MVASFFIKGALKAAVKATTKNATKTAQKAAPAVKGPATAEGAALNHAVSKGTGNVKAHTRINADGTVSQVQAHTRHVNALNNAGLDRDAQARALQSIVGDKGLKLADLQRIAMDYSKGGVAPKSRKAALKQIEKRSLERIRSQNQINQAAKARPW